MKKRNFNLWHRKTIFVFFGLFVTIFTLISGISLANEFVTIKTSPEYAGDNSTQKPFQYIAFKQKTNGSTINFLDQTQPLTNAVSANNFVRIKIFPEHVGVFTTVRKQQFVAFGVTRAKKRINITNRVDWKSSNTRIVSINGNGLATIMPGKTFGQVKISCSYPKTAKGLTGPYHLLLREKPEPKKSLSYLYYLLLKK